MSKLPLLLLLVLSGCTAFNPPKAPVPNERERTPVNLYQPYEIQGHVL